MDKTDKTIDQGQFEQADGRIVDTGPVRHLVVWSKDVIGALSITGELRTKTLDGQRFKVTLTPITEPSEC